MTNHYINQHLVFSYDSSIGDIKLIPMIKCDTSRTIPSHPKYDIGISSLKILPAPVPVDNQCILTISIYNASPSSSNFTGLSYGV